MKTGIIHDALVEFSNKHIGCEVDCIRVVDQRTVRIWYYEPLCDDGGFFDYHC